MKKLQVKMMNEPVHLVHLGFSVLSKIQMFKFSCDYIKRKI